MLQSNSKCKFYFAHPYLPLEQGKNENTNGLIRQYFPKKMLFTMISHKEVLMVMARLNHRSRNYLDLKHLMKPFTDWIRT